MGVWHLACFPNEIATCLMAREKCSVNIGDKVTTTILDVAHGGHCIARVDGEIIFVRHAIPGEVGVVEITSKNSKIYRGDLIEVLEPSESRIKPTCKYANPAQCGGCAFAHVDLDKETEMKKKVLIDQFAKIGKIDLTPFEITSPGFDIGDGLHWRRRMNFALTPDHTLGLHSSRSSKVLEIGHCFLASQPINNAAFAGDPTSSAQLSRSLAKLRDLKMPVEFSESNNGEIAVGYRGKILNGVHEITESVRGVNYEISPHSFWQSHDQAAGVLVDRVNALLDVRSGDTVLDLYSGVGLFAAHLILKVGKQGKVILIESDSHSGKDAQRHFAHDSRAEVLLGKAEKLMAQVTKADIVVLDPPRAGADPSVIAELLRLAPRQILYISCDPATLARDVAALTVSAEYAINTVNMYNLYPRTHHLESVVLLNSTSKK